MDPGWSEFSQFRLMDKFELAFVEGVLPDMEAHLDTRKEHQATWEPWEVSLPGEGMEGVAAWYREDNGELFDPNTRITEDLALYAMLPGE